MAGFRAGDQVAVGDTIGIVQNQCDDARYYTVTFLFTMLPTKFYTTTLIDEALRHHTFTEEELHEWMIAKMKS